MRRKFLLLLETGLVLAGLLLGASAWKLHSALEQPLNLSQEQLLDVPAGSTPTGTFNRLQADGVIQDAFWLRLYWRFNLPGQPLHSGEYRMTPDMTAEGLIGLWQRGEVVQYSLTLVEGWNFRQVRSALAKSDKLQQTLTGLSDSQVMEKLGHGGVFPEGRFFPDTYRYVRGMRDIDLLRQAHERLDQVLALPAIAALTARLLAGLPMAVLWLSPLILLVVLLYLGLQIVCQGVLGPALAGSSVPIAEAAGRLWDPARIALLVTACVSMAGFLLGSAYGAAMALVYGLIGLVVILTAGTFGTINASPWFNLGIAVWSELNVLGTIHIWV